MTITIIGTTKRKILSKILKKYTPYVKSLNITLKDIMFDAKKWNKVTN